MPRHRLALASLVLSLLAAACGSDDGGGEALNADIFTGATTTRAQPSAFDEADTDLEPLGSEAAPPRIPWSEAAPPRFPWCWDYQHAWERHDASLQAALAALVDYTDAEAAVRDATDELDRAEAVDFRDDLRSYAREHMVAYWGYWNSDSEARDLVREIGRIAEGRGEGTQAVAYARAFEAFSSSATTEDLALLTHLRDIFNYWEPERSGHEEWAVTLGLSAWDEGDGPIPMSPALKAASLVWPALHTATDGTWPLFSGALIYDVGPGSGIPLLEDALDDVKATARAERLPMDVVDLLVEALLEGFDNPVEAGIIGWFDESTGSEVQEIKWSYALSLGVAHFLIRFVAIESLTGSDAWSALHESLIESCRVT